MKLFSFSGRPTLKLCALLAVAAMPMAVFLPGCGGGGGGGGTSITQRVGGTVDFNNGQFGTLGFARFSNGTAFGTFVISNSDDPKTGTQFPVGSYDVSGNVSGNQVTLRGTIPSGSLITIVVTQSGTSNGTYAVTIDGKTFNGVAVVAKATPTPTTAVTATPTTAPTVASTPVVIG